MTAVLQILAAILGVSATLWINKIVKEYIQRYEDAKQEGLDKKIKETIQEELIRRDKDAEKLREIESKLP